MTTPQNQQENIETPAAAPNTSNPWDFEPLPLDGRVEVDVSVPECVKVEP